MVAARNDISWRAVPAAAGQVPNAETLLLGALAIALADDAAGVLAQVRDDDMTAPANAAVLAAIRAAATAETYGPAVILDELTRRGAGGEVRAALLHAMTAGAANTRGAVRRYAAAAVAARLRQCIESGAHALAEAAENAAEDGLTAQAEAVASAARGIADRLAELRGGL